MAQLPWDHELRQTGKAALAKLRSRRERLDGGEMRWLLRELDAQYTEPPFHGHNLDAELRCTSNGWIASTRSFDGRREVHAMPSVSAEAALDALVEEFDKWRDGAHRQEEPEPVEAERAIETGELIPRAGFVYFQKPVASHGEDAGWYWRDTSLLHNEPVGPFDTKDAAIKGSQEEGEAT